MNVDTSHPRLSISSSRIGKIIETLASWLTVIGLAVAPPMLRIALAVPFFKSGLTRWDGFLSLSPSTEFLFSDMFKLHIFGNEYPFPMPDVVAHLVGMAEITLPILLVLGLGTRFVALALLVMTGIIQLTVPEGWANFHLPWASMALAIMALGPGRLSLDAVIAIVSKREFRKTK
ncbi:DoxX (plasmid) [Nitrobacter hamburgensis X14]|uniref:DoxX n=1 Tax=Nitrobacter hamburgensis (strain DSM 10229 / NCIMB 13809 / X14) TaxID=323097 RepID=Q1QEZ0_NITHX|nr:DoxX family protein [Nitrobacter hamburgensis]ABE65207.1 DoxX [Nitrobacter hamburgensis X14]